MYPSGHVCLKIISHTEAWRPGTSVEPILLAIQDLLDRPNMRSPVNADAYHMYKDDLGA